MASSGGAFLSTLKEKNERQRLVRQRTATASSMRDKSSRKSFFGSFFGVGNSNNRKNSSGTSDSMRQAAREASFEQDEPQNVDTEKPTDIDTATILSEESVILHENTENGAKVTVVNNAETNQQQQQPGFVAAIAAKSIERSEDAKNITPAVASSQVIREVSSTGKLEAETPAHESAVQVVRQRRVSTTIGISGRRMSSSIAEHAVESSGYGRERTPSVATMEEIYGRTARDPRNFEMTNPLLAEPNKSSSRNRGMSVTQSAVDVDVERAKRASLYNSAPHVDQAMLLERRNTRAGRTASMDVRDRSSTMEQPVEALS